jgi:aminoglycoside phosphotransferase (APT) family kinase protein
MIDPELLALARAIGRARYGAEPGVEPVGPSNHALLRLYLPAGIKVLKLAPPGAPEPIAKELAVIELVRRHALPAPVVEHADPAGAEHGRAFVVMAQAGDRTVLEAAREPGDTPRRLFHEMGALHARIHGVELPASGRIRPDGIEPSDPGPLLAELATVAEALAREGLLEGDEATGFRALRLPPHEGLALCHGDYHAVQCVVRMGRIAAVVDWEAAWAGNPAIDCGVTQAYLEQYAPAELVRAYLAGYTSVRALPPDYGSAYLPVRMVQVMGVLRAWRGQGDRTWQAALAQGRVAQALRQYRIYAGALAR